MATPVTEDLIVQPGQVLTYTQNGDFGFSAALIFNQLNSFQPSLTNYGEMRLLTDSTSVQRFISFATTSFWDRALISNYGKITALLPYTDYVTALHANSWSPNLLNSGTIEVAARTQALAYESWDSSLTITNLATGLITATSFENTLTLYLPNGATITNAGQILAEATGGAIVRNSCAISAANGNMTVTNSGLIKATDNSTNLYSVAIAFGASGPNTVTNSGTIHGDDYAIKENNPYGYNAWAIVRNSGLIEGTIALANGNDFVSNAGQIKGDIDLGTDSDVYDGTLGSIIGTVFGGAGNDLLIGGAGRDVLNGGTGDDILFGGGGDSLTGGAGRDTFVFARIVSGAPAEVLTDFASGTDRIDLTSLAPTSVTIIGSTVSVTARSGILTINVTGTVVMSDILTTATGTIAGTSGSDALVGGPGGVVLIGGDGADLLVGSAGNDRLDGGSGDNSGSYGDVMWGGGGDDTYVFDYVQDFIVENPGGGYDTIEVPAANPWPLTMPDNVERAIGGSVHGNSLDNTIIGSTFGDLLDGGGGADQLFGGLGNDIYYVDRQADLIFENPGEGTDTVESTASFYLNQNIENLTLAAGAGGIFGVGNALDNVLSGNEGANLLIAGAGADVLSGGAGNDNLYGQDGADTLNGDAGIDYLVGGIGDDTLDGGANADALYGEDGNDYLDGGTSFDTDILVGGAGNDVLRGDGGLSDYDLMDGGAGDDIYWVDTGDDLTFEALGGGIDTVHANIGAANAGVYLYANVENLVLEGTTSFGVGNALDNSLTGNAISNYLLGGLGNDTLNGMGGGDVLFGEAGNDTFVFGIGTGGDVIGDFTRGQDKIDISAFGFSFAQAQANFIQDGNVGAINLGNGDFIVLHNVTMSQLTAADFILGGANQAALKGGAPVMEFATDWGGGARAALFAGGIQFASDDLHWHRPQAEAFG